MSQRGQQVFLRADDTPALPSLQDALLQLASVVDVSSLQTTIKDVLRVVLPDVECVFVYLLEAESRLRCEDPPHEVPPEGKLRDAVKQQKRLQCSGLPSAELHQNQSGSLSTPLPAHRQALVIPLVDGDEGKVIALILVCCKPLTEQDEQNLTILEKHLTVACKRVRDIQRCSKRPHTQSHNAPVEPKANAQADDYRELDRKILRLCGELYDLDAASLQLKVINYIQCLLKQIDAHHTHKIQLKHAKELCFSVCLWSVLLAVGEEAGYDNISSDSRMDKAVVVFVKEEKLVNRLITNRILVGGEFVIVSSLVTPKVCISNVPPFIENDDIERALVQW
ncbi:cGMP-dependent 3',5'-cyclic phosphodiesterase isoform X3 [Carassius gibelio]|uniref:cGMP-dependent 3',5'-cyclic phosphodiesterase isoform X3 n=1 Tax=Carassius gibelio TaxID=101364 RepID=UPI002277C747|nr:cGMP-dependent 3',5'-cyclic phosphodiesterase isoform X3 [Carassius gibelio]